MKALPRTLLILVAIASFGFLGRLVLHPESPIPAAHPVALPAALAGWQPIPPPEDPDALPHAVRFHRDALDLELQFIPDLATHYVRDSHLELRFLPRGHLPLDAGLRYYANSRGGIIANLHGAQPITTSLDIRSTPLQSHYALWTADSRLHLSTLVTPSGSGMDTRQIARRLYLENLSVHALGDWLLGRQSLPDRRCALVHLSTPFSCASRDPAAASLTAAWLDYQSAHPIVFPP